MSGGLRWAAEAAIERLLVSIEVEPDNCHVREAIQFLHDGLHGAPAGLSAKGSTCPLCGCARDENHVRHVFDERYAARV